MGAISALGGFSYFEVTEKTNAETVVKFITHLRETWGDFGRLAFILDNHPAHRSRIVTDALSRNNC